MKIKTGVKRDGAITAMDFQSFLDGGAYGSYGVASTFYTGALQTVTYNTMPTTSQTYLYESGSYPYALTASPTRTATAMRHGTMTAMAGAS